MATAVQMPLRNLVDLAIGSPEVGAVNFTVLHAVLHVLAQQAQLSDTPVEFRGPQAERIETVAKTGVREPSIFVTEYRAVVNTKPSAQDAATPAARPEEAQLLAGQAEQDDTERSQKVVVVQSVDDSQPADPSAERTKKVIPGPLISPEGVLNMQELSKLQEKVSLLHEELARLQQLPSDEEVLERARAPVPGVPVEDLWKYINLEKRVEALEDAILKLSSLTQKLAKDTEQNRMAIEELNKILKRCKELVDSHENGLTDLSNRVEEQIDKREEAARKSVELELDPDGRVVPSLDDVAGDDKFHVIEYVLERLWQRLDGLADELAAASADRLADDDRPEATEQDGQVDEMEGQVEDMDQLLRGQMEEMQGRIDALERDLGVVMESVRTGMAISDGMSQEFTGLSELYIKLQDTQKELAALTEKSSQIEDEQKEKAANLESLLEELQHLRLMKADKEELELALEKKADQTDVKKKVSQSQFETISEDLMKGIDQALGRLTEQELMWKEALEQMQQEMEGKIDKEEVSPVQEFVNQKLLAIQEKLKALQAMREDTEAAGAKRKLLRNVQCISCDKNVVMKRQSAVPCTPGSQRLTPHASIKPYLTYELDKIRKQQRKCPQPKNLRQFEDIMRSHGLGSPPAPQCQPPAEAESAKNVRLVNRYCGGSHTVTTPEQKARRLRPAPAGRRPSCGEA
ncbi:uncharacterized protein LOC134531091 isoform X2 [Bacillus rossius redtenbacheri]|uniref:uncharacterized protein LOC134531091 isoform X2 n=1 Tax=Bacillus rossius redtenbacheri TaxID=93214 RepID=UPI002FDEB5DD